MDKDRRTMIKYMHIFLSVGGLLLFAPALHAAGLDDLVQEALQANSSLKASAERWHQSEQKAPQVTSLDDPMLSFAFSNYPTDTWSSDETPMTGNEFRLSQKFPFPGKLQAKGEAAEAEAEWYASIYRENRLQVAAQVKDAYYQIYFLERAIEVTKRNIDIIDQVIRLAETRYSVGDGLQQDVLKAQVERSRFLDRLWEMEQKRTAAYADLEALIERYDDINIEFPEKLPIAPVGATLPQLQRAAEDQRPQMLAYRHLVERFEAQERFAQLDKLPDLTLWAGYRFRDNNLPDGGTDFGSLGFSVNLPIYRAKRNAQVAEAGIAQRNARRQQDAFISKVRRNLTDAYARMEQTREQATLYREALIPQASQAFQASMAAYQVGKIEFISLLDALLTLNRLEIEQVRSVTDYQRSIVKLDLESGKPLPFDTQTEPNTHSDEAL